MSRKSKRCIREISPDPIHGSDIITRMINMIMLDGKKEVAEKIMYGALEKSKSKIIEKFGSISNGMKEIIMIIGPEIETKTKRIGGSNYQIPIKVEHFRRVSLGMKWLIQAARSKKGTTMMAALSQEILLAIELKGEAYKKNINVQKMAAANKAYSHLA